jgi:hypothetical protein
MKTISKDENKFLVMAILFFIICSGVIGKELFFEEPYITDITLTTNKEYSRALASAHYNNLNYKLKENTFNLYGIDEVISLQGSSMLPTFSANNKILIRHVGDCSYNSENKEVICGSYYGDVNFQVGDILIYYNSDEELVCHRLVGIYDDGIWLAGDNVAQESMVSYSSLYAYIIGVIYT